MKMFDLERYRVSDEETNNNSCRQALTLVFIQNQELEQVYDTETAFCRGTAFPDLDKPWKAGGNS
jgi:hypothetical protein